MFCRRLSRTAGASSIAYGFGKYRDVFDFQTGTYRQLEGAGGLTCATFVLGVFHAARLPLLNDETWPKPSQADLDWEISIARTLASKEWSSKQAESVVSQVPAKRYQPHEVTAAALSDSLPATFEQIKGNAIEIKRLVLGRYLHNLMANEEYQRALPIADSILERFGLVPNSVEHQPDIVTLEYKNRYGLPKVMWLSLASNPSSGIVRLIDNQRLSMEADLDNIDEVIATFDRGESSQAQNRH